MSYLRQSSFTKSLKGKVIIAFLLGFVALVLAWTVSKVAFREMLTTVQSVSAPDEKLLVVNQLFRDITKLDQFQRSQSFQNPGSYKSFFKESDSLRSKMDTLKRLYSGDKLQIEQINKMKDLLKKRDSLFTTYLRVREGLVNGKAFSSQINSLTGLISRSSSEMDSTIVKTEQTHSTTTIPAQKEERDRGFFNRLFGKKKADTAAAVVQEEINITIDTLARVNTDSVVQEMENAVKTLALRQRQRSDLFISQEIELANAGNILINQILDVLQQVEKDVISQVELSNLRAQEVVNHSANRIEMIMLIFLFITAVFAYMILTDIGKSNRYRQELELARDEAEYHGQAKQRFLSSMSHEIRTPLQSIIGYAEQLQDQEKVDKKNLKAIYNSAIHLLHIVNEVLDYSRIVSGKFKFHRSIFNISEVMDEVVTIITPQAERKGLNIRMNNSIIGSDLLIGDPFRLKQILINVVGNAVKFTSQGEVTLTVTNRIVKRKAYLTIEVTDTGMGISEEDIKRIFTEFEQAGNYVPTNENGTGLGLSIVKTLVEGQGGTIDVKSVLGEGTSFTLNLRYTVPKENKKLTEQQIGKSENFRGLVWLVDDDPFILQLCCNLLDKHHVRYKAFSLPSQLLEEPIAEDLSLIMMDIRMPEMNGTELCRRMRQRLSDHVRIVALTAQALPEERASILEQGFDALLMKPFRETDLTGLLRGQLSAEVDTTEQAPQDVIDLSMIEKMAFGDEEMLKQILERFCEDNRKDAGIITEALKAQNRDELTLLLHRLAGRTSQLGARSLGAAFRAEELLLHQGEPIDRTQEQRVHKLLEQLESLTQEIYSI
ncbi:signal transduction histidine kinase [Arcticibacter pallidicorallinus]|uniref:histidine kinase n=1 Tax=Arcticibacter pallidicorallinus TaxID=1259464 RepID=A0A2T0TYZ3_9SPHI|nr:ATP-binding protein [Arcticibacter pallidicorallinus]PRY50870.1 signal transduction histidine kinase [Arcticibacter pallidicorallinus]